ncbi:class I SAM-dependent methyltransferase [Hymenobacter cellulosivorans]|uniref:Methyltransferase domain-containing protein n=1 Tax=Hymenobacter cellulosivorans TaxID=2932249 RepID=A0ABY4F8U0_9BACT|nr:methyltransferase domain-containing protein [Hymenobacter cellulosivorans]UOQ52835.1 methyltransferase domain-containing protein [Hymenobacter cellulosivorans]
MTSAKEQFDRQAAHYNTQWNTWSEALLRWLLEHADAQPTDTVLDVATGTGFTALAFAPHVQSVVGLDVSTGMLAEAQKRQQEQGIANVTWLEGAAEQLPFPDASFSIVTCRVAPHHFDSVPQFLAEVRRVLQPGGQFLLADTCVLDNQPELNQWQNYVEKLRDPSHARNLEPREWRAAMEAAGLVVEKVEEAAPDGAMQLNDWLTKAGCTGEKAEQVRREFQNASVEAQQHFQIQELPGADFTFVWQRVVAKAVKP